MNERTGLDCPSVSATTSNVPQAPAGSVPAHPAGDLAWRFQAIVPAGSAGNGFAADSAMEVMEVNDVREAMKAAFRG